MVWCFVRYGSLAMAMGCAAGAEEGISGELNIMHCIAEASKLEAFDDIVEGFETEYPDVKVNASPRRWRTIRILSS